MSHRFPALPRRTAADVRPEPLAGTWSAHTAVPGAVRTFGDMPTGPDPSPAAQAGGPRTPTRGTAGRPHRTVLALAAVVLLVAVVALTAGLAARWGAQAAAAEPAPSPSASATATPTVSDVAAALAPSLVAIEVARADGAAIGSGVVVTADGTVLTAWHVVADATAIQLTFSDGTTSTATVAASDETTDTAQLTPATLPSVVVPAVLGGQAATGATVVALGSPLGLTGSVSAGVVSGLDRTATVSAGLSLSGLIQFDAAVNPGSSGGPLVDDEGHVLGIVVALANPAGDDAFAGIGFAVPIGTALGGVGGDAAPQL